jgi:hypothetical protein
VALWRVDGTELRIRGPSKLSPQAHHLWLHHHRRLADVLASLRPPQPPPPPPRPRASRATPSASAVRGRVSDVPRRVPGGRRARGVPVGALPALDPPPVWRRGGWGPEIAQGVPHGDGPRGPPLPGGPGRLRPWHPHPLHRYGFVVVNRKGRVFITRIGELVQKG